MSWFACRQQFEQILDASKYKKRLSYCSKYICEMKKLIIYTVLTLSYCAVQAQVSDTLGWDNFMNGTETLYQSPISGYAFGNNGYGDKAKAQTFSDSGAFVLKGAVLKFGIVDFASQDSASSILVNVYLNGGLGVTLTSNTDSIAPDSIIATRELPVYELIEGDYTNVDFSSEEIGFSSNQEFSIGVAFDNLSSGDTVGLVSTTDGDAASAANAWELTSNNNWIAVAHPSYSWNLDVDLGIFAVIDRNDPAGIVNQVSIESLSVYPNPTDDLLFVKSYAFTNQGVVGVDVCNSLGQIVWSQQGILNHSEALNLSDLSTGMYFIRIFSNDRVGATTFIKR